MKFRSCLIGLSVLFWFFSDFFSHIVPAMLLRKAEKIPQNSFEIFSGVNFKQLLIPVKIHLFQFVFPVFQMVPEADDFY